MAKKQFSVQTELTARIDNLTSKLNTANQRVNHFKRQAEKNKNVDVFGSLTSNIGKYLPAIGAASVALKTFQGVTENSQVVGDNWNFTIAAGKGALEGLYRTIANGDFSNLIDNMIRGSEAAEELARKLDEMGEIGYSVQLQNVEIDIEIAKLQKEIRKAYTRKDFEEVLRLEAELHLKVDEKYNNQLHLLNTELNAYADNVQAVTGIKQEDILDFLKRYKDEDIQNYVDAINEYEYLVDRINLLKDLKTNNPDSYKTYGDGALEKAIKQRNELVDTYGKELFEYQAIINAYNQFGDEKWQKTVQVQTQIQQLEVQRINETTRAEVTAERSKEQMRAEDLKKYEKYWKDKLKILSGGAPDKLQVDDYQVIETDLEFNYGGFRGLQEELKNLQELQRNSVTSEQWAEYQAQIDITQKKINEFTGAVKNGNNEINQKLLEQINTVDNLGSSFNSAAYIAESFGNSTVASIFDVLGASANLIEMSMRMQAQYAAEGATAAVKSASHIPYPFTLAAMASALSGFLSIISSIPKFEVGGIVGGTSFKGDKILARVNSGERILTAEQNRIFEQLASNNNSLNGDVRFEIKGDRLVGVLNNYNRKTNINR